MERLWVFVFLLFLNLHLGRCIDAEGKVSQEREVHRVTRVIQAKYIRKGLQLHNKYRDKHFSNKAGWSPAFRSWKTWENFQGNIYVPPLYSPKPFPKPNRQSLSPPVSTWEQPSNFPPSTSFPSPQSDHFLSNAPAPSPALKTLPLPLQHAKPTQSVTLPPLPPPVLNVAANPEVDGVVSETNHAPATRPIYVFATAGASFLLAISITLFVVCYRSSKVVTVRPWVTGLSGQLQKAFVTGVPALKRSELQIACEDFSNVIGSLSDYMMYKGTLSSGVEIAVVSTTKKSSKDWSKHCEAQFRKKITSLSRVNHKNFVNLLGYCEEEQPFTRMMVFEYAPNGTLFEHLHVKEDDHLDWPTRLRVAVGIAYCLEHMHQLSPPEIPRTLDTSTIYLTDDFAAKISDIFFCEEPTETEIASLSPVLSDKESVVYSYGMILLEIMTGKFTVSDGGLLENWTACYLRGERQLKDMIEPNLKSYHADTVDKLNSVIRSCTAREPTKRPTMSEVALQLKEITSMPPDAATPKASPLWWAELEIISTEAN